MIPNKAAATSGVALCETGVWTPAGDATATVRRLLAGETLLRLHPYDGEAGEAVPLALDGSMIETAPPRWWERLLDFAAPYAGATWGQARTPILVSSSNYGVGNLLRFRQTGDAAHLAWGTPHRCLDQIGAALGWGPNRTLFSHACVTAQLALVQAERLLAADLADQVLVFSFDFLSPFVTGGFHALKILNHGFPAPYTDQATGSIGLGDGAAAAILARAEPGESGPRIRMQRLHNELHHFTSNRADGEGFRALLRQFDFAGLRPWVKGHGTGTLEAGRLEAEAVAAVLPEAPLVSWKGGLGHTLGSCALVELGLALEAVRGGQVPGTVGLGPNPFTTQVAREPFAATDHNAILLLSNAFGGAHAGMLVTDA